jgi:hypothetical protein
LQDDGGFFYLPYVVLNVAPVHTIYTVSQAPGKWDPKHIFHPAFAKDKKAMGGDGMDGLL